MIRLGPEDVRAASQLLPPELHPLLRWLLTGHDPAGEKKAA